MNKQQELAEQILKKHFGHAYGALHPIMHIGPILAAIVEAMELPAKEAISVPAQQGVWKEIGELPEIGKWYLIHTTQCGVIEGFLDGGEDGKLWLAQSGDLDESDTVTHWMPLPEPPAAQPLQPSLEEKKEDLVANSINTDVSFLASHSCTDSNSIEQETETFCESCGNLSYGNKLCESCTIELGLIDQPL